MSWIVFAVFAAVAIATAAPAVTFGDGGEFIAAAATLSAAHPPGYPLYSLVGKAFGTLLPWGTWAWRMNLLSGLCAAGALALLFSVLRRAGAAAASAAVGVLFLGSRPLWLHTNAQAEIFALHLLSASACFWVVVRASRAAFGDRTMAALGLLLGLATGAHHTLALAVPPLLAAAYLQARPSPRAALRGLSILGVFLLLGASVQLFLPIRSAGSPALDWGHPVDLLRFLRVFLRRDYGPLSLTIEGAGSAGGPGPQTLRWLAAFAGGFGITGVSLAALGLAGLLGRDWRAVVLPVGLALCAGPLFLCLGNPPFDVQTSSALERFWLLPWVGGAWLIAAGADLLWRSVPAGRAAVIVLFLPPLASAWSAAPAWAQRSDLAAHDYGRNLLRSLPRGAALFIDGGDDSFYTLTAALYADGLRPDLAVADRGGLVFHSPYGPDFRSLSRDGKDERRTTVELQTARRRPVYFATLDKGLAPGGSLALEGLLRRFDSGPRGAIELESARGRALWAVYARRHDAALGFSHYRYRALIPFYRIMEATARASRGEIPAAVAGLRAALAEGPGVRWVAPTVAAEAQWAGWAASQIPDWPAAEAAYRMVVEADPGRAEEWSNLGVALERQGRMPESKAAHERAVLVSPGFAKAHFNFATLLYRGGEFSRAAVEFGAAAKLDPADAQAALWAGRASARSEKGHSER